MWEEMWDWIKFLIGIEPHDSGEGYLAGLEGFIRIMVWMVLSALLFVTGRLMWLIFTLN